MPRIAARSRSRRRAWRSCLPFDGGALARASVRECHLSGNRHRVAPAKRIVVAFAICGVVGWALAVSGVTHLPPTPYIVFDVALDVLIVIGLWMLYRPVWRAMVGLTVLAE